MKNFKIQFTKQYAKENMLRTFKNILKDMLK